MWVIPGLVGPPFGAMVAAHFGWRYAFVTFLPLVTLSAALVLPALAGMTDAREEFDLFSASRSPSAVGLQAARFSRTSFGRSERARSSPRAR
jgi:predicted MFS family arabinose efflux permease